MNLRSREDNPLAMVGVGLALWAFSIAWPGTHLGILVASAALVAFADNHADSA
jgi:hypothetical protein